MSFLYFAYGSNLHPLRLAERTPSCLAIGPARLRGYALRFHKRSLAAGDGSGKCDAFATGRPDDVLHGAVYRIDLDDRPALDAAEGNGRGYDRVVRNAETSAGSLAVELYVAQAGWIDPALRPFDWYLELVVAGAAHHELPIDYRHRVERTPVMRDADARRSERHYRLARGSAARRSTTG